MKSTSRKVNGYIKAVQRRDALATKLGALTLAFEERTRPLRAKLDAARIEAVERERSLNGGQMAAARKLLLAARAQEVQEVRA